MLERVISRKCGCNIMTSPSGRMALSKLKDWHPDVVLTDIKMPDIDGLTLLRKVKEFDPTISVIIMTGYATIEFAVRALKDGAYDFFEKPFEIKKITHAVSHCLERTRLLRENQRLHQKLKNHGKFHGLIGKSEKLAQALDLISRVADTDVTVLIRGESGTGKELAAQALHAMSSRAPHRMITVNCPALPEQILESELFGYTKGAFTGATRNKQGLFLAANGSTILLDEIADIPVSVQTKLLRVLQEKEIRPLGQNQSIKIDVRVIASTNQDLETKIERGLFREDLFYRLNVVTIEMPALREIPEDIPLIAQHFLNLYATEYGREGISFARETLSYLMNRQWKGNVRELQNVIKRSVLLATGPTIYPRDIPSKHSGDNNCRIIPSMSHLSYKEAKQEILSIFSKAYLTEALTACNGNVTAAATRCGLERQALQRLMRRYGLRSVDFRYPKE